MFVKHLTLRTFYVLQLNLVTMMKRTLSFAATLLLSIAAFAQWTMPTAPTEASELISGHSYMVRNADSDGLFLAGGVTWYSWATSLMLVENTEASIPITYTIAQEEVDTLGTLAWTFVDQSTLKYTFVSGLIEGSEGTDLAAFNGLGELHIDMASQGNQYFDITEVDAANHLYHISLVVTDTTYANSTGCLGFIKDTYTYYGTELYSNAVYAFLDPSDANNGCNWEFVDYTIYDALVSLYELLQKAVENKVDTSAASAVYNNSNATLEEIEAAILELQGAINDAIMGGASRENPMDVTELIENPDFETGDISGWDCTFVKGTNATNIGYQSSSYTNDNYTYVNHEGEEVNPFVSQFIEAWANAQLGENTSVSRCLGDAQLSQTMYSLPEGQYKLSADVIAVQQDDESLTVSGVQLFATGGTLDNYENISTGNGVPEHIELIFLSTGGDVTLGLRTIYTDANWIAADNFELVYYGEFEGSASFAKLQTNLESAQAYTNLDTYHYSEAVQAELEEAIAAAQALLNGEATDDELEAGNDALLEVIATVRADIQAYTSLATLIEKIETDMANYESMTELSEMLSDMHDQYNDAYEDRSVDVDQIAEWTDSYDDFVLDYIKSVMADATEDNPIDITVLCTNMDYADNTNDGWTKTSDTGNGSVSYHTSEVWNSAFTNYQTLENMPAGSYKLTAKAFYRTADNETAYTEYESGTANILTYLVVATGSAPVVNHAAGAVEADEAPYTGYTQLSNGLWIPNTMQSAEYAFNLDDTYACEATGYLVEDGDLTFGLRNEGEVQSDCWSIWTNLRLYYTGKSSSALYETLQDMIAQAAALQDEVGLLIAAADTKFNEALTNADAVYETSSEDEMNNAISELQAAIDYANEGLALITSLTDLYNEYMEKMGDIDSDDETLPAMLEEIANAIESEEFESNEQMEEWMASLPTAWTAYVQYPVLETSSEDNPGDISAAILNPGFDNEDDTSAYWDITIDGGSQNGTYNTYECYNNTTFVVSQTINGLADGYYRVRVQGMYRPGGYAAAADTLSVDPDYGQFVLLFANTVSAPICNIFAGGSATATGISGEVSTTLNDETIYIPNTMQGFSELVEAYPDLYWNEIDLKAEGGSITLGLRKGTSVSADWTIWNEFQLLYLGTNEPTGIEALPDAESAVGTVADVKYYSVDGVQLARPAKGVNIVKSTMADGTTKVQKVLVK